MVVVALAAWAICMAIRGHFTTMYVILMIMSVVAIAREFTE